MSVSQQIARNAVRESIAAMEPRAHWERVYREKAPNQVSWFEPSARTSFELIAECGVDREAPLIDVGGGASRLAGELLAGGYTDITVADISAAALARARAALGERADRITWIEADVRGHDFGRAFRLWHDRALFHFMVDEEDRNAYLAALRRALDPGGQLVISTFAPEGPPTCSGLPVQRYGAGDLAALLPDFELASARPEVHRTPGGKEQRFLYARLVRSGGSTARPASDQA